MTSFSVASCNAYVFTNAQAGDAVLRTNTQGASILFGTSGDTYAALTLQSNVTQFTDALTLSNAAGQVALYVAAAADGARPPQTAEALQGVSPGAALTVAAGALRVHAELLAASNVRLAPGAALLPESDSASDLGAPDRRFRSLYVSGNTVYIGSNALGVQPASGALRVHDAATGQPVRLVVRDLQLGAGTPGAPGLLLSRAQDGGGFRVVPVTADAAGEAVEDEEAAAQVDLAPAVAFASNAAAHGSNLAAAALPRAGGVLAGDLGVEGSVTAAGYCNLPPFGSEYAYSSSSNSAITNSTTTLTTRFSYTTAPLAGGTYRVQAWHTVQHSANNATTRVLTFVDANEAASVVRDAHVTNDNANLPFDGGCPFLTLPLAPGPHTIVTQFARVTVGTARIPTVRYELWRVA